MKNKVFLMFIVLSLILIPLTSAVPPFQTSDPSVGLVIEYPKYDYVKAGEAFKFHIHVFNATNGLLVTNETTDCLFHGYDLNGGHTIESLMDFDSNGVDFTLEIPASEVGVEGGAYIVQCNTSTAGGFVSGKVAITMSGKEFVQAESNAYMIMLIALIVLLAGAAYGAIKIPYSNKKNDDGQIIGINDLKYLKVFCIFISYGILTWMANLMITISNNYIDLGVALGFFTVMFKAMMFMLYPIMIFTVIFMIIEAVKDGNIGKLLDRGLTG